MPIGSEKISSICKSSRCGCIVELRVVVPYSRPVGQEKRKLPQVHPSSQRYKT